MRYTPSQTTELTGLSRETLRYWRKILPPLSGKKGKFSRYSAGDLLALLIINEIVDSLCMNITAVADIANQLFETCQGIKWNQIRDKYLNIDIKEKKVSTVSKKDCYFVSSGPIVLMEIGVWLNRLSELLVTDKTVQIPLPFSPMIVKKKVHQIGGI